MWAGDYTLSGLVGFEMRSKVIGVVGTGAIGAAACRIFSVRTLLGNMVHNIVDMLLIDAPRSSLCAVCSVSTGLVGFLCFKLLPQNHCPPT